MSDLNRLLKPNDCRLEDIVREYDRLVIGSIIYHADETRTPGR